MFNMFNQFFTMLSTLFSAGERSAKILDNWAAYGEETSQQMVEAARAERALTKQTLAE
jgi:hypothetical protein